MSVTTPEAEMHWLGRFVYSRSRRARLIKLELLLLGLMIGLAALVGAGRWLTTDNIYDKDFLAIYVLVRAIAEGADPFTRIDVLADRYIGGLPFAVFGHPTPHPPTLGVLVLPLAGLPYHIAAWVWFGLSLICLAVAAALLVRIAGARLSLPLTLALAVICVAWHPIQNDLMFGQMNTIILLAICGMVLARRAGRRFLAGALPAVALLIKPVTWPLALVMLLKRDWRSLAGVAITGLLGVAATLALIGPERSLAYVGEALPEVSRHHERILWNISIWTSGHRIFTGTLARYDTGQIGQIAPPLVDASYLALPFSAAIALILLAGALWQARQLSYEWGIGIMVCASIVLSPIAWNHYLTLALLPIALAIRSLAARHFPARLTSWTVIATGYLLLSIHSWETLGVWVTQRLSAVGLEPARASLALALLTLGPTLAVIGLGCLMIALGRAERLPTPALAELPQAERDWNAERPETVEPALTSPRATGYDRRTDAVGAEAPG